LSNSEFAESCSAQLGAIVPSKATIPFILARSMTAHARDHTRTSVSSPRPRANVQPTIDDQRWWRRLGAQGPCCWTWCSFAAPSSAAN